MGLLHFEANLIFHFVFPVEKYLLPLESLLFKLFLFDP